MGNSPPKVEPSHVLTLKTYSLADIVTCIHISNENGAIFVGTGRGAVYCFCRGATNIQELNVLTTVPDTTDFNCVKLNAFSRAGIRTLNYNSKTSLLTASVGDEKNLIWNFQELLPDDFDPNESNAFTEAKHVEYSYHNHSHSYQTSGDAIVLNSRDEILLTYRGGSAIYTFDSSRFVVNPRLSKQKEGALVDSAAREVDVDDAQVEEPFQKKHSFLIEPTSFPVHYDGKNLVVLKHASQYHWKILIYDMEAFKEENAKVYKESRIYANPLTIDISRSFFLAITNGFEVENMRVCDNHLAFIANETELYLYSMVAGQKLASTSTKRVELLAFVTPDLLVALSVDFKLRLFEFDRENSHLNIVQVVTIPKEMCNFFLDIPYSIQVSHSKGESGKASTVSVVYNDDTGVHYVSFNIQD